jgi:drug/metabolite transporter (DMT)-like permease
MKIVAGALAAIAVAGTIVIAIAEGSQKHSNAMGALALLACVVAVIVMIVLGVTLGGRNNPRRAPSRMPGSPPVAESAPSSEDQRGVTP